MNTSQRKFAAFDLDGTLFRASLSRMLMLGLIERGILDKKALDDLDPYYWTWKNREHPQAFREYDQRHIEVFNKYIKGVPLSHVVAAAPDVVNKIYKKTYIYTRELITQLQNEGYVLLAITASPHEIAHPFAKRHNFDILHADRIRHDAQGYCIDTATTAARDKKTILTQLMKEHNLTTTGSLAIGDTASDIGMLELVEQPIAFNPSKELFDTAKEKGWKVIIERKNMIYELEPGKDRYYIK